MTFSRTGAYYAASRITFSRTAPVRDREQGAEPRGNVFPQIGFLSIRAGQATTIFMIFLRTGTHYAASPMTCLTAYCTPR